MKIRLMAMAMAIAAVLAGVAGMSVAQAMTAPPLPALSAEQSTNLDSEMARYRTEIEDRVARGELAREEADRLLEWRRWQLARQIAGLAPEPRREVIVRHDYVYDYPPYYAPAPYYWGPPPYYWYGPRISVCAGRFGRHSFGSLCF